MSLWEKAFSVLEMKNRKEAEEKPYGMMKPKAVSEQPVQRGWSDDGVT